MRSRLHLLWIVGRFQRFPGSFRHLSWQCLFRPDSDFFRSRQEASRRG